MSAAELAAALRLRRSGQVWTGACPACGYKGAFSMKEANGRVLVHCHAGCPQAEVIDALRRANLWAGRSTEPVTRRPEYAPRPSPGSTMAEALRLWRQTRPAAGTPVAAYLSRRGYDGPIPPALRFLPRCWHKETRSWHPAMVGPVERVGSAGPVAIHRTYLQPDGAGKAKIAPSKMTLGPIKGGAVRLAEAGAHLAVAEGIETGLSVQLASGIPAWAAISAGGLRDLILPPLPLAARLTIAADADPVGLEKAPAAAFRWRLEGRSVRIAVLSAGQDLNDLLLADDREAAP